MSTVLPQQHPGLFQRLRARLASFWPARWRTDADAATLPVRMPTATYGRLPKTTPSVAQLGIDQGLLWSMVLLLLWGLVMVYSASIAMPDNPRFANYKPTHFLNRHLFALLLGTMTSLLAFQIPVRTWEKWAPWLFAGSLLLLVIVLVPGIGRGVNGARRWIGLGVMNFQPSELAKLATVLYAADYIRRKMDIQEKTGHMRDTERFVRAVAPMALAMAVVGALLLAEPDMGAFLVIAVVAMGILFFGGVNARMFFLIGTILVLVFASIIAASPFRRERIFAYLDPWSAEHALGKGYQLSHALIAVGRGGWFGVGLGGSVEKLHWLPEAHTDFLLAVIGEELGFSGIVLLIGIFFWLTRRIIDIGRQAISLERTFAGLAAQGIGLWIGFQAFINIGVNLGALPTKGLTLPLMSYGGSAILLNMIALAVVMRIDYENRILMKRGSV